MEQILSGQANDALIAALLTALRMKGETVDEPVALPRRCAGTPPPSSPQAICRWRIDALVDTCGTGGDASGTFNVSTGSGFRGGGCGCSCGEARGNRSISSRCGSADVLEHLGVRIDPPPVRWVARVIEEVGIGFLFAPAVHAATRHAMTARRYLAHAHGL